MLTSKTMNLSRENLDSLQTLIRMNLGSAQVMKAAAADVHDPNLRVLFEHIERDRRAQAAELQEFVYCNGEDPQTAGGLLDALHLCWLEMRSALKGGRSEALLSEAERAEQRIQDAYRQALEEVADGPLDPVLLRHHTHVSAQCAHLNELRRLALAD